MDDLAEVLLLRGEIVFILTYTIFTPRPVCLDTGISIWPLLGPYLAPTWPLRCPKRNICIPTEQTNNITDKE